MMMPPEAGADSAVPAALEQVFGRMQSQVDGIENSDDIEGMINAVRGDQQPIEARRAELAEFVGPDDAQQTPESVLALVQPVMQLASVDQGIGSLAAEEMMDTPVEGPMAEGIMSTVNMAPEMPMEVGNQPPVNFRQGGAVVSMQGGGSPEAAALNFAPFAKDRLAAYEGIITPRPDQAANLAEQERLAKSQMLFDIANTALRFATPGSRQMSPAERLAEAAQETQLLDKIGARSQGLLDAKRADELAAYEDRRALELLALESAEGSLARASSQKFASGESALNRTQDLNLQSNQFNFTTSEREAVQTYQDQVREAIQTNQIELMNLENNFTREGMLLKDALTEKNMALQQQYTVNNIGLEFNNTLEKMGVANAFDIGKMELGHEQNIALTNLKGAIERDRQLTQNAFTAAESALDRALRKGLQASDQEFKAYLQEDMQLFNMTEADKDRAIAKVNRAFEETLALRGADQKDRALSIDEAKLAIDNMYKSGMLAVEQLAVQSNRLGSKAKTKQLSYLTDVKTLEGYANKTLGEQKIEYDQMILDYITPKSEFNQSSGKFERGAGGQLAPAILNAIKQGDPEFYNTIVKTSRPKAEIFDAPESKNLVNATTEIFNEDGTVNTESELFDGKGGRFDPSVDYPKVIGASGFLPGKIKALGEFIGEFTSGPPSESAVNFGKAQTALEALANDMLLFNTNQSDDRVLKFVQEFFEKETRNIRPGGFFTKTDADARATFEELSNTLQQGLMQGRLLLEEYGGDSTGYTKKQITGVRRDMNEMKFLLNDVLAFQKAFKFKPTVKVAQKGEGEDQSLEQAKAAILAMRKNND
jgi:hypothetical protein